MQKVTQIAHVLPGGIPVAVTPFLEIKSWRDLKCYLIWAYSGPVKEEYRRMFFGGEGVPAWFIKKGSLVLRFEGHEERFADGVWVFPKRENGYQYFSEDAVILSIRFIAEWPTGTSLFDRSRTITFPENEASGLLDAGGALASFVQTTMDATRGMFEYASQSVEGYFEGRVLFSVWMKAYVETMLKMGFQPQADASIDDRILRVLRHLELLSMRKPFREDDLAAFAGLSKSQLNRLFIRYLGRSPKEFWEAKRLSAAQAALVDTRAPVKEIAYQLGFSSLPHFSNWMRKKTGLSPRDFRESSEAG